MPYEIEFHPVGNGSKSGDAITIRYFDAATQSFRVIVVDGGYGETGEKLVQHIRFHYGTSYVDHVVSTHPDSDHISGLIPIMEELEVGTLWLHVPFLHAEAMMRYFLSSRWTVDGLRARLRSEYPAVSKLIDLANRQGTSVEAAFLGAQIGPFTVLSPSRNFYEGLLPQFRDTPQEDRDFLAMLGHLISGVGRRVARQILRIIPEDAYVETLREGGTTAAENESSVVLGGAIDGGVILLTADAGLRALTAAADYADAINLPLRGALKLFQVPHHGSRNNVSPSILDRIVGPRAEFGSRANTWCVVSAGPSDDTHPRQVVVNALRRRGLEPASTRQGSLLYVSGVPVRKGMIPISYLPFSHQVEAYD
jgi:beta-lactamase superfamily II metal-dependent hydrolase